MRPLLSRVRARCPLFAHPVLMVVSVDWSLILIAASLLVVACAHKACAVSALKIVRPARCAPRLMFASVGC